MINRQLQTLKPHPQNFFIAPFTLYKKNIQKNIKPCHQFTAPASCWLTHVWVRLVRRSLVTLLAPATAAQVQPLATTPAATHPPRNTPAFTPLPTKSNPGMLVFCQLVCQLVFSSSTVTLIILTCNLHDAHAAQAAAQADVGRV